MHRTRRAVLGLIATLLVGVPSIAHAGESVETQAGPGASAPEAGEQLRDTRAPRVLTRQVQRGQQIFVRVAGRAQDADVGRLVVVDGQVGRRRTAGLCQTRVDRDGDFVAACRVDRLFRQLGATVRLTITLPATSEATAASTTATRAVARPLRGRLVEGVGVPGLFAIGDTRAQMSARFGPRVGASLVRVRFSGGRVSGMLIFDRAFRTGSGIGIGSSRAAVRRAYPGARCVPSPMGPGRLICFLSGSRGGQATEMFFHFGTSRGVGEISVHRPGAYASLPGAPS